MTFVEWAAQEIELAPGEVGIAYEKIPYGKMALVFTSIPPNQAQIDTLLVDTKPYNFVFYSRKKKKYEYD